MGTEPELNEMLILRGIASRNTAPEIRLFRDVAEMLWLRDRIRAPSPNNHTDFDEISWSAFVKGPP